MTQQEQINQSRIKLDELKNIKIDFNESKTNIDFNIFCENEYEQELKRINKSTNISIFSFILFVMTLVFIFIYKYATYVNC